ncbi:unnamed protein product [Rotaria magnacalcarata]|uniref:G domain-containing protein n=1 Tax=Rotaria magnacalcarata TaxID=392030 RepID=A0A819Q8P2_9BILA|nr:unnamed protein product [Rotaria magnacalcarata]CAF2140949.1 unnamed protein product [Rotaria magnacalcarata]CAF4026567.1 unnamed protein product [Rotaria magnacalcarata]CAF4058144.1 unnamed protein product [Rotaria magnacalcarata]
MAFLPLIPLAVDFVKTLMGGANNQAQVVQDPALVEEFRRYREQNAELMKRYTEIGKIMKEKKIDSFEALQEHEKEATAALVQLARNTEPHPMQDNNVALFGLTSTGKTTMLNSLSGSKVAETGSGKTTMEIKPYHSERFTLWDIPGRNDETSYLSMH